MSETTHLHCESEVQGLREALRFLSTYEEDPPESFIIHIDYGYDRLLAFVHDIARAALEAPACTESEAQVAKLRLVAERAADWLAWWEFDGQRDDVEQRLKDALAALEAPAPDPEGAKA